MFEPTRALIWYAEFQDRFFLTWNIDVTESSDREYSLRLLNINRKGYRLIKKEINAISEQKNKDVYTNERKC